MVKNHMADNREKTNEQELGAQDVKRLLRSHWQDLFRLRKRAAIYGHDVPIRVLNAIDEQKEEIARLEKLLGDDDEYQTVDDKFLEIQHIDELLKIHRKNLRRLKEQAALFGMYVPVDLCNKIDDAKEEISKLETRLDELITQILKHKDVDSENGDQAQHLNHLLTIHRKNLHRLQEEAKHYKDPVPVFLRNQIDWEEQEIGTLEAELRRIAPRTSRWKAIAAFSSEQWRFFLWVMLGLAGFAAIIASKPLWLKLVGVLPIIGVGFDLLRWRLEGYLRGIILSQVTAARVVSRGTQSVLSELRSLKSDDAVSSDVRQKAEEDTEQRPEATPSGDHRTETFAVAKVEMPQPGELPRVGEEFILLTGILQRIPIGFVGEPIELPDVDTLELDVAVYAEDMTVLPLWTQKLRYYVGRDSGLLEFKLCPNAAGQKEIRVEFLYRLHWLAQIKFEIEVAEQKELALLMEPTE